MNYCLPYQPSFNFDRTPQEHQDIFVSWARADRAFFAAGACHILADLFVQLHMHEGYNMVFIKPAKGFPGSHVFASNGNWAFDHNGWTKEKELMSLTEQAYTKKYPGWTYQKIDIKIYMTALEDMCKENNHRLPWQFAHLPWERAYKYIKQFPDSPPEEG
jgi:hypothetical protein